MSDKSPSGSAGISRGAGALISLFTAAIVFGGGMAILPRPQPPAPPPSATPPPPPTPPPAEAMGGQGGATATGGQGGEAAGGRGGTGETATPPEFADEAKPGDVKPGETEKVDGKAPEGTTGASAGEAAAENADGGQDNIADCSLPEKDMAREAWRRNWPTICSIGDKGFILIPVKGPIQNAIVELKRKPVREARVSIPQAESQLTLKLYKLKRLGFKDLKVGPMDESANTGTRLRVRLMPGAGDPVFDVKDGYAKITVATPDKSEKPDKD
jgi:hypothetical protein